MLYLSLNRMGISIWTSTLHLTCLRTKVFFLLISIRALNIITLLWVVDIWFQLLVTTILRCHPLTLPFMNNVLHAPKLIKKLISVCKFTTDNSVSVVFYPLGFGNLILFLRLKIVFNCILYYWVLLSLIMQL